MDVKEASLLIKINLCSKMETIHWGKCAFVEDRGNLRGWFQVMSESRFTEIFGDGEFKKNGMWDLMANKGNTTGCKNSLNQKEVHRC